MTKTYRATKEGRVVDGDGTIIYEPLANVSAEAIAEVLNDYEDEAFDFPDWGAIADELRLRGASIL